jgi:serine-type D-Ala-D-Ala carboxypeptidase
VPLLEIDGALRPKDSRPISFPEFRIQVTLNLGPVETQTLEVTGSQAPSDIGNPPADPGRFAEVHKVLRDAIDSRAFPGCAYGVLKRGDIFFSEALGSFTYEDGAPSVKPHTVFDVASLTKVVSTTAIAMSLFQTGQLDLDTPVGDLLPGFVVGRGNTTPARLVTLRNLLAHNSGLPGYVEFFREAADSAALFRACLDLPIEAAPGERSEYSDPGFILLGKALEVLTHEPLSETARRQIFEPLGMTSTCFGPNPELRALIPPTEIDAAFRHRRIQGEVQDENAWVLDGVAGHAGLFSNVPDLLRLAGSILASLESSGAPNLPVLFSRDTLETFSKRQPPPGSSRALGWDTPSGESSAGHFFSPHSIGHLGYSGCSLWIDLDTAVAAVLLTNRTWPDRQSQAIRQVRPAFHDAVRKSLSSV